MKLSKEEFIEKYSAKFESDDEKIEFLEDISDSIEAKAEEPADNSEEVEKLTASIEQLKVENEMLKKKYIDRFMNGEEAEEKAEDFEEKIDEPEAKEIIDIKEI